MSTLRWFPPGWDEGDPDEHQAVIADYYGRHLPALTGAMSESLRWLAQVANLHDAQASELRRGDSEAELRLLVGDLQVGYQWVTLQYADATVEPALAETLLLGPYTEVLYDEVDREADGGWEHRLSLRPQGEVVIRFKDVQVSRAPATSEDRR